MKPTAKKAPAKKTAPKEPTKPRTRVDWDALAVPYRAGIRALKDIGIEFGVSDAAIIKHARKEGWTRDLKGKIKALADKKVSAALVSAEVSAQTKITEKLTVEVEATVQARVKIAHRVDIGRYRALSLKLVAELEHQTDNAGLYEQLFELLTDPEAEEEGGNEKAKERQRKRREVFERALSLPGRNKTMKEAADTLRILIALEREAFGIDDGGRGNGSGYEEALADVLDQIAA